MVEIEGLEPGYRRGGFRVHVDRFRSAAGDLRER